MSNKIDSALIDALRLAKSITVLTGAGMSAESGIPTFREAQTGLWEKYDPEELATFEAFEKNPKLIWDWYKWRRSLLSAAKPHAGHFALLKMSQCVPDFHLITQNVDQMHQRAGNDDVLELHGDLFSARNTKSGEKENLDFYSFYEKHIEFFDDPTKYPLTFIRPNIVWFGEQLPSEPLHKAQEFSESCDAFIIIGTSGQVYPAAALPKKAKDNAALVIEINSDETPLTEITDYSFRGLASQWLPALVEAVWGEKTDIDNANLYVREDVSEYPSEVLNMIARYAALPVVNSTTVYPASRSVINVLMDEAVRRKNGEAGRNKNNFYINVFGQSGEPWYTNVHYYSEGLDTADLFIYQGSSFNDALVSNQIFYATYVIIIENELQIHDLPDSHTWTHFDGCFIGLNHRSIQEELKSGI